MLIQLFVRPLAVDHKDSARFYVLHHLVAFYNIRWVVAGNEVRLIDIVWALDRVVTETKMGDRNTSGLLGVILEVGLNIFICVVTDDLCGVLIRTNGTVSAKTPELTLFGTRSRCDRSRLHLWQTQVCHIIHDTDGKAGFWSILFQLFVNGENG